MGKTALVIGAIGFIGSHMTKELTSRGWEVDVCDIKFDAEHLNGTRFRDALFLFQHHTRQYDLVVHAAATAPYRAAIDGQPANLVRDITLDGAMFRWAIDTQQRRVLYISSSAAYPASLQRDIDSPLLHEDYVDLNAPGEADANYGYVKVVGERMAAIARECDVPVTVVRPFSGYSENQSDHWPFTALANRVKRREDPLIIWGTINQRRDWIHVDDLINGMLAVANSETTEPVNICTGRSIDMFTLVKTMIEHVSDYSPRIRGDLTMPTGVLNRVGDPRRFHRYYAPTISIEEGVKRAMRGTS